MALKKRAGLAFGQALFYLIKVHIVLSFDTEFRTVNLYHQQEVGYEQRAEYQTHNTKKLQTQYDPKYGNEGVYIANTLHNGKPQHIVNIGNYDSAIECKADSKARIAGSKHVYTDRHPDNHSAYYRQQ